MQFPMLRLLCRHTHSIHHKLPTIKDNCTLLYSEHNGFIYV